MRAPEGEGRENVNSFIIAGKGVGEKNTLE